MHTYTLVPRFVLRPTIDYLLIREYRWTREIYKLTKVMLKYGTENLVH